MAESDCLNSEGGHADLYENVGKRESSVLPESASQCPLRECGKNKYQGRIGTDNRPKINLPRVSSGSIKLEDKSGDADRESEYYGSRNSVVHRSNMTKS